MKNFFAIMLMIAFFVAGGAYTSFAEVYISGNLDAVFLNDSDVDDGVDTGQLNFEAGLGLLGAVGVTITDNTRIEVELGYRSNDIESVTVDGLGTVPIDGDVNSTSVMGNVYYDFKNNNGFIPFVGVGIGFTELEADIATQNIGREEDTVLAYQAILGGGFVATDNVTIDLQYRYFATENPDFSGLEAEYRSHDLMLGFRYSF